MEKKRYKVIICISILVMLFVNFTGVFGVTNPDYTDLSEVSENVLESKIKGSFLLDALANMINAIASLAEWLIGSVFNALTGDNVFPWADRIIFNGIKFLDINFLNPDNSSLFKDKTGSDTILGDVILSVYSTIFSLAVLFLGVAVGIMAIRLAISAIAAEKAKYKQAIVNWCTCIVMLFMMHYILSFIFWVNEQMVQIASGILINTIEKNKLDTINFQDALNNVLTPEQRVNNFINMSGADKNSNDAKILIDHPDIANSFLISDSYLKHRVVWFDKNKDLKKHAIPCIAMDIEDANAIAGQTKDAKKGYYDGANGRRIWFDEEKYRDSIFFINDCNKVLDLATGENQQKLSLTNTGILKVNNKSLGTAILSEDTNHFVEHKELKITADYLNNLNWQTYIANLNKSIMDSKDKDREPDAQSKEALAKFIKDAVASSRLKSDQFVINVGYNRSSVNAKATDIIASLGSFFKQSAYVYTTETTTETITDPNGNTHVEQKEVVNGWRATKVSVTGALLYAIFIFQSCLYLMQYVKRLFYIIMLSMFGPIVVIYDFVIKATG